jgi:hypothetical protein
MNSKLRRDESAASTELGYVFTFLLGVLLLSMFSVWTFGIETATRQRWNETAIDTNLADIADAVERADIASREGSEIHYAESVEWRLTEADETLFTLSLTDEGLFLEHPEKELNRQLSISATGSGTYEGEISLSGLRHIWIVHEDGVTSISATRPTF